MTRNRQEQLEMEVLQYKEQVSSLQDRLDSVTKVGREEQRNITFISSAVNPYLFFFFKSRSLT